MDCNGLPQDPANDETEPTSPTRERVPVSPATSEVTQILSQVEHGDSQAAGRLLPLVYEELRKLAAAKMAQEKPDQTLQATALVHEAYIRLVDVDRAHQKWDSRGHFFQPPRSHAADPGRAGRRKGRLAAGGQNPRVEMSHVDAEIQGPDLDMLALSEALDKLATVDSRAAALVKLRFFAGLTRKQAAELLDVSVATVDTDWAYAKCWLHLELSAGTDPGTPS